MSSGTDEFFLETLQNFLCSCQKSLSSFLAGFFRDWRVHCGLPRAFTSPGVDTDVMWTLILSFIFNSCLYTIVPTILCRYFYPVLYSFIHFRLTIEISFLLVLHLRGEPGSVFSMTSLQIECCYNVHSNFLLTNPQPGLTSASPLFTGLLGGSLLGSLHHFQCTAGPQTIAVFQMWSSSCFLLSAHWLGSY